MGRFREAIVGNEATLVREFADIESLWRELLTRKILSAEQLQKCQSEVSHLSILETAMFSLRDAMHTLHYMQIYNAP